MDLRLLAATCSWGTVGVQPCLITLFTLIRAPLSQDLRDATPSPGFVMLRLSALHPRRWGSLEVTQSPSLVLIQVWVTLKPLSPLPPITPGLVEPLL